MENGIVLFDVRFDKAANILPAFAQGGNGNGELAEVIVNIFTESPVLDTLLRIPTERGNNLYVQLVGNPIRGAKYT